MEYYIIWARLDRADRYLRLFNGHDVWKLGIQDAYTWADIEDAEEVLRSLEEDEHEGRYYIRGQLA